MLKRLLLILLAAVVLGGAFFMARTRLNGELHINPRAKIDPDEKYTLQVWMGKPLLPNTAGSYVTELEEILASFTSTYPNITIETYFIPELELEHKLSKALEAGEPPDVYFHPLSSQVFFGELQVPFGIYVSKEQSAEWLAPAMAQSSSGGKIYAYPTAFYSRLFMANPMRVTIDGINAEHLAEMGWTWDEFYAIVQKSTQAGRPGLVLTNYGAPLARAIAASTGKPAPLDDEGKLIWTESDIANMADIWHKLNSIEGIPSLNTVNEDCLTQFLQGKAAIIGPLNPLLTVWLSNQAQERGINPVLLPIPSATDSPFSDLAATSVIVFRQVSYKGHSHTRAAIELARHMGEVLGPLLSKYLAAIPYGESYLPFGAPAGQAYSDILRAPLSPYAYGPKPGLSEQHWVDVIYPLWNEYVTGKKTAEGFTSSLYSALTRLAQPQQ